MKKYIKEMIACVLQLTVFLLLPRLLFGSGPMSGVFMMLCCTLLISALLSALSSSKLRYLFPIAAGLLFLPTIPIYYNSSALVHCLWYFIAAAVGMVLGRMFSK